MSKGREKYKRVTDSSLLDRDEEWLMRLQLDKEREIENDCNLLITHPRDRKPPEFLSFERQREIRIDWFTSFELDVINIIIFFPNA